MKRRHLAVATFAVVVAMGGWSRALAAPPVEISYVGWGGPEEREIFKKTIARFERENPDIKVKYIQIPGGGYDYFNKLRLMIVGGIGPDVFNVPDGNFGELVSRGVLLNLDPYLAKSKVIKTAEMWESGLVRYRWDGRQLQKGSQYCLPKDIGPHAMFYNKDVLAKHGIPFPDPKTPMTWDQAVAVWKKLSFKDDRGIQHYGVSGYPYESAVWSNGGEIVSADKRSIALNSPAAIAALQWVADLSLVHKVAPDAAKTAGGSGSASPGQLFESGVAAMHFDGRWMVPRFRTLNFDWDVAPVPVPKKGAKSICWSGSVGFGILASSKKADPAFRFIEYLAGPEGQKALTASGFQVPNQKWLAKTPVFSQPGQRPAHPEVFLAAAETSRSGPWTDTPNTFWHDVMWNYLPKVFRGDRKAQELVPEITPMVNQTLRDKNTPKKR